MATSRFFPPMGFPRGRDADNAFCWTEQPEGGLFEVSAYRSTGTKLS